MSRLDTSSPPPPPEQPVASAPARLWPTVIGVLSMVLGARGILAPETGGPSWVSFLLSSLQGQTIGWPGASIILLGVHGLRAAAAVLLVLAGWLLWRRRRGAALHVVYPLVAVPCLIALPLLTLWAYGYRQPGLGCVLAYHCVGGALPGLAYAIFLLVWFRRGRIRQQLRAWRKGPAGAAAARPAGSVWPTVLGVLSMVLGGMGLFSKLWSSAGFLMVKLFRAEGFFVPQGQYAAFWLVGAAAGLLLLVAGRLLHRRRPSGATCHLIYAALEALIVIGWAVAALTVTGSPARLGLSVLCAILASWLGIVLLGLIYPVFLLVWFTRPKIRSQVKAWRQPRPQVELPSPDT